MPTNNQILNALTLQSSMWTFDPNTTPANRGLFEDITDWSGIGIQSSNGDTVDIIARITSPTGSGVYENSGYASSNFASPDTDLSDLISPTYSLPLATGTSEPIFGVYQIAVKCQVTPNGDSPIVVEKTFNVELCDLRSTVVLSENYNCANATYTSVDNTSYGKQGYSVILIEREHTVYPPQVSGQNDVSGDAQTLLLAAPDNQLWTGTYEAELKSSVTYKAGNNYFYCFINGNTELKVVCDNSLCTLFCYLKKLYANYFSNRGVNSTVANQWLAKWQLGSDIYAMIAKAQVCAPNDVASLTAKFYEVTGFSEGCECGCDDSPAPVVPSNIINGENGTDGRTPEFRVTGSIFQWKYTDEPTWTTIFDFSTITGLDGSSFLQGSGVPSSGLGENGDSYLDIDSGDIYLKSAGSWSVTGNIKGANGVAVLYNDISNSNTTKTFSIWEALGSYNLLKTTLGTNEDEVKVKAVFTTASPKSTYSQSVRLSFGGTDLIGTFDYPSFFASNIYKIVVELDFTRVSNVLGKYYIKSTFYGATGAPSSTRQVLFSSAIDLRSLGSLNFTTTDYAIEAEANSDVIGDITLESFEIIYLKKQ